MTQLGGSVSTAATDNTRLSAMGLVIVHAVALLIAYAGPVFICPTMVSHYSRIGLAETPLFARAHLISDILSGSTRLWISLASIYLFVLYRRRRAGSRWLPAVSNLALLSLLAFGFVFSAWMATPMAFSVRMAPEPESIAAAQDR